MAAAPSGRGDQVIRVDGQPALLHRLTGGGARAAPTSSSPGWRSSSSTLPPGKTHIPPKADLGHAVQHQHLEAVVVARAVSHQHDRGRRDRRLASAPPSVIAAARSSPHGVTHRRPSRTIGALVGQPVREVDVRIRQLLHGVLGPKGGDELRPSPHDRRSPSITSNIVTPSGPARNGPKAAPSGARRACPPRRAGRRTRSSLR